MSDPTAAGRKPPSVSVIIPTYRHAEYVRLTLDSVFAQTFSDYEVIVVNDGSPDDTAEHLQPLASAGRIRYFEQENGGQGAARNRGLAEARGEFIALLDDDDLWPPDKLAWQVQALRQNPRVSVVYGRPSCIDSCGNPFLGTDFGPLSADSKMPCGRVYEAFMTENPLISPGLCLVRRAAFVALGERPFDPAMKGCDDWEVWLRLARQGEFLFVERPALCYRLHDANASRDHVAMCRSSLALRRKMADVESDPALRTRWRMLAREAYSELATLLFADAKRHGREKGRAAQALAVVQALVMDSVFGVRKLSGMGLQRLVRRRIASELATPLPETK